MDDIESSKLVRHATFYLPFGDLVVQSAPDANGVSTLFRVNKSILAFNSPVFAGMFALPGSGSVEAQDVYDDVPIVRLSDPSDELATLFSVLHNPSSLSFPRLDPDIPILLTGIMRLATKYEFDSIRARIVEILHESWPQSFERWLRFRSELAAIQKAHAETGDGLLNGKSYEECIPEPAAAIRFARDFDVPSILPLAFYTLSGISLLHDWDASRTEGRNAQREFFVKQQTRTARWQLLDIQDYQRVMRCREMLATEVEWFLARYTDVEWFHDHVYTVGSGCIDQDCETKLETVEKMLKTEDWDGGVGLLSEGETAHAFSRPNPLELLEKLEHFAMTLGMCSECRECMLGYLHKDKRKTWDAYIALGSR